jgi:hypothetical protein
MSEAVVSKATIQLEAQQAKLDRDLDEAERKAKSSGEKMENSLSLGGLANKLLGAFAALGAAEASFKGVGAAASIMRGDVEAAEGAIRSIPFGVGPAVGALIDLHRVLNQDTEATARLRAEWLELGRTVGDTQPFDSALEFLDKIQRDIAELTTGTKQDPLFAEFQVHRRELDDQVAALATLRIELERYVSESEQANVRLEKLDLANSVRALRDGELGRGALGLLGVSTFSFGIADDLTQMNLLVDALREAGITATTSDKAFEQIESTIEGINQQARELEQQVGRLGNLRREQEAEEARAREREQQILALEREDAFEQAARRRIALLEEESQFEKERMRIRFELEDRLANNSSIIARRLIREEAELRLRAVDERFEAEVKRAAGIFAPGFHERGRERERDLRASTFTTEEFTRLTGGGAGGGRQEVRDPEVKRAIEEVRDAVLRAVNNPGIGVFG